MKQIKALFFSSLILSTLALSASPVRIEKLNVELDTSTLYVAKRKPPRFSWKIASEVNGTIQKAFQIQVSSKADSFGSSELAWDSGEKQSQQSLFVPYGGSPLEVEKKYFARVRIWAPEPTEWSAPTPFLLPSAFNKVTPTSSFECSNSELNQLFKQAQQTQLEFLKAGAPDVKL